MQSKNSSLKIVLGILPATNENIQSTAFAEGHVKTKNLCPKKSANLLQKTVKIFIERAIKSGAYLRTTLGGNNSALV